MKAVILVGGEGTRLRPLTCNTPKPMLPLVNRPFLDHFLENLKAYGFTDVALSMCYRPDVIERHIGSGADFGINVTYAVETTPLGTAGGVKNAQPDLEDTFFVFNGDVLTDLDLGAMLEFHRSKKAKVTISLTPVADPSSYGLVETTNIGRVTAFIEKPSPERVTTNLINAGTYIVEPEVMHHVPHNTFWMFERQLFPMLLERNDPVFGFSSDGYWLDIGTPAKYLAAHLDVLSGRMPVAMRGREISPGVWADGEAQIDPSAEIVGPMTLGRNVKIEGHVKLLGPLAIGDCCWVKRGSVIAGSVIWHSTIVEPEAVVGNSLVGARCTIGHGAKLADCSVVGDDCVIGARNRLDRGIRIWPSRAIDQDTLSF